MLQKRYREVTTMLHGHELKALVPDTAPELLPEAPALPDPAAEFWTQESLQEAERLARIREWREKRDALNAAKPVEASDGALPPPLPPPRYVSQGKAWSGWTALFLITVGAVLGYILMGGGQ